MATTKMSAERGCGTCNKYKGNFFCTTCATKRLVSASFLMISQEFSTTVQFLGDYESSPLSKDFRADIKFIGSDGEEVYAHKFIMVGRSMVFRRMFNADMKEKESGVVQCPDASAPVLRSMVNFCYTADIQFTEEAPAEEVLKIAHKYDINILKLRCEDELKNGITNENICELLVLAHKYEAKELNQAVADYFKTSFDVVYPILANRLCSDST